MHPGKQTTSTRDEYYDLVSVLYHALKGADVCDLYALDAEVGGRMDLYEFFREARVAQTRLAEQAKELLGIGTAPGAAGSVPAGADSPETEVVGPQAPPEGGLPAEAPPESDLPVDVPTRSRPESVTSPEPDEDVAGPGVPPDAPRTGEFPPSPSEPPPRP